MRVRRVYGVRVKAYMRTRSSVILILTLMLTNAELQGD